MLVSVFSYHTFDILAVLMFFYSVQCPRCAEFLLGKRTHPVPAVHRSERVP